MIDTPAAIYENVYFADTYWQLISYPEGQELAGAYNREWTAMPGGYHDHLSPTLNSVADHLNVHLAYHATIDLAGPTDDGEGVVDAAERADWFNTYESEGGVGGQRAGFVYSRLGGGNRRSTDAPVLGGDQVVDGVHDDPALGGFGARTPLTWNNAVWPNVITVDVVNDGAILAAGSHVLSPGVMLDISYSGRDFDSASDVTVFFDADRNPYNSNTVATVATVNHGASGASIFSSTEAWDTSALASGSTGFVGARITDGVRTRYLYAAPELVFDESIFSDRFESGDTTRWSVRR